MSEDPYDASHRDSSRIKDLPPRERPRERLLRMGPDVLSTPELLALLIGSGTSNESALGLARRLLGEAEDIRQLANFSTHQLKEIRGIGKAKAARLRAGFALAERFTEAPAGERKDLSSPEKVYDLLHLELRDMKKEQFVLLILDGKNKLMERRRISEGTLTSSLVHPREVFKPAVRASAAGVIFVHNHPSGDPAPSQEDLEVTERLEEASEILGIPIMDHVIIGADGFRSFRELDLI